jgi:hypothetical protein
LPIFPAPAAAAWRRGILLSINESGSACFQETLLLLKDLRRLQRNHPRNLINDCQSLIKRPAMKQP